MKTRAIVLLIDHDQGVHQMMRAALSSEHILVEAVESVSQGRKILRELVPNMLILEIGTGGATEGLHLLYDLRRDEIFRKMPVIVSTDVHVKTDIDLARELGTDYLPAQQFIAKPIEPAHLRQIVLQTLESNSFGGRWMRSVE
ncbi:MAG: response regulator [Phycisphaerae bacterium]|nr:response regulator [Phycisphaerae bacterium]